MQTGHIRDWYTSVMLEVKFAPDRRVATDCHLWVFERVEDFPLEAGQSVPPKLASYWQRRRHLQSGEKR